MGKKRNKTLPDITIKWNEEMIDVENHCLTPKGMDAYAGILLQNPGINSIVSLYHNANVPLSEKIVAALMKCFLYPTEESIDAVQEAVETDFAPFLSHNQEVK